MDPAMIVYDLSVSVFHYSFIFIMKLCFRLIIYSLESHSFHKLFILLTFISLLSFIFKCYFCDYLQEQRQQDFSCSCNGQFHFYCTRIPSHSGAFLDVCPKCGPQNGNSCGQLSLVLPDPPPEVQNHRTAGGRDPIESGLQPVQEFTVKSHQTRTLCVNVIKDSCHNRFECHYQWRGLSPPPLTNVMNENLILKDVQNSHF